MSAPRRLHPTHEMPDPARSTASFPVPPSAPGRRDAPDHARHRPEPVTVTATTDLTLHGQVADRLRQQGQRYTAGRRELVGLLQRAGRPLAMHEIVGGAGGLPQSSIYRNLVVLERVGAVTRYPVSGGHGLYELSEVLVGHHHHLICTNCGRMEDLEVPYPLEGDLERVVEAIAAGRGFRPTGHRLELVGVCADCV